MTTAPNVRPLRFHDLDEAVAVLRERGLRLSTPRRMVLEALFAADGPVSAEHLATGLNLDLASVYRNLEALEANGVVQHVHLGHGPGLHALVGPAGEREHLYCERCGAVRAVSPGELDPVRAQIRERFGFEARFTHFAIAGVCADCAGK
jgi:Fur family transcriptional regulator, ferric uptake regulator